MQIWLDTTQTDSDDGPWEEDCIPNPPPLRPDIQMQLNENEIEHISTLSLHQSTPLHIQECTPGRWLICNPTGTGKIAILDAQALSLFESFHHSHALRDLWPLLTDESPERTAKAVALLYKAGLLCSASAQMRADENNEERILTSWLHVTNACNLRCHYCYLEKTSEHMEEDTAFRAVDAVFRSALQHKHRHVKLKYAGGEASLHMARVLAIHDYALQLAQQHNIALSASILSNGVVLSQRAIENLKARDIRVMISLDGIGSYHDRQRPFLRGQGSFSYVDATIRRLLASQLVPNVSVTVSQHNLNGIAELLEYLLKLDLPFTLNYYRDNDYAKERSELQFSEQAMIDTMRNAFKVIEHNLPIRSLLGSLIDKANMHYSHQQTCSVGNDYLVIDQHGGIAKCHADIKQTLTTIAVTDPLQVIRDDRKGIQNLPVDAKKGCRTCEWRYWCAGGCPLLTYRMTGRYDKQSPNCRIYQALFPEALRLEALRLLKYVPPCLP
jgi:uncharacterized protein